MSFSSFTRWLRAWKRGPVTRQLRRRPRVRRPRLELLEDRVAPAVFQVNTTADNGDDVHPVAGSLREAILRANASAGFDMVQFALPATDPHHSYYPDDGL